MARALAAPGARTDGAGPRRAPRAAALARLVALALAVALAPAVARAAARPTPASTSAAGERLYRDGLLPAGRPLRGDRDGGARVEGREAACATCHRRSGLGSWEGQSVVPPIIGRYLFRAGARNVEDPDLPHVQGYLPRREAYTDATLARALREGRDPSGRRFSFLMPRYDLDAATMASLVAYLHELTRGQEPGVDRDTLHFATIVTPDADPIARRGMLDVLEQFFAEKNEGYRGESRPMQSTRGVMYRVTRRWALHVWELTGPPDTWEAQLRQKLAETPVLAVISGIGGRTWAPVHRFCEQAALPCLWPNVDLPVAREDDFYPVYFSKGVLLEAGLVARSVADSRGAGHAPGRLVQLYRPGDEGEDAARALRDAAGPTVPSALRPVDGAGASGLAAALAEVHPGDALVLWLRPGDVAALPGAPPDGVTIYASGLMGGLERTPLPRAWRAATRLTYPYDLPDARRVRMNFPLGWFSVRRIPVVDERVQTDTYLACVILAETVGHMLDSFVRDYLVERLEMLVSHRQVNGYFPRLSLAPGQRFASKGGYLVRLAGDGARVVADGGWIVP